MVFWELQGKVRQFRAGSCIGSNTIEVHDRYLYSEQGIPPS